MNPMIMYAGSWRAIPAGIAGPVNRSLGRLAFRRLVPKDRNCHRAHGYDDVRPPLSGPDVTINVG